MENISLAHKRQEHFYSTWIFHLTKTIQFKFKILWNNTLEVAFDWRDISTQGESPDENIFFEFDRGSGVGHRWRLGCGTDGTRHGSRLHHHNGSKRARKPARPPRAAVRVDLSPDQKTRLHAIVASGNLSRVDHVNFALSVGTRIPHTLRIYGVPQAIVDIVPQYRGFDYIVVKKDLLIIDPRTLEILYVLPG